MGSKIIKQHCKGFKEFMIAAKEGFERGARTHKEGSNKKMNLFKEIKEELRDVACYAYFQYEKINELEKRMEEVQ